MKKGLQLHCRPSFLSLVPNALRRSKPSVVDADQLISSEFSPNSTVDAPLPESARAMIAQLTKNERQLALIILLMMSVCGLVMAVVGQHDPLGIHGAIVLLAGILGDLPIAHRFTGIPSGNFKFTGRNHETNSVASSCEV
jgi:hypothetical protein